MSYRWIFFAVMGAASVILGAASVALPERYGEMIDDQIILILVTLGLVVLGVIGWSKQRSERPAPGEAPTIPE
jgi:hypothetical protein